jgi:hypothetical protein
MRFRGTISFVVLFTISITAFGQGFQGGLRGSVRDAAGAVVPGVEVMLTNEATNLSRMTLSNESGDTASLRSSPARIGCMFLRRVSRPSTLRAFESAPSNSSRSI